MYIKVPMVVVLTYQGTLTICLSTIFTLLYYLNGALTGTPPQLCPYRHQIGNAMYKMEDWKSIASTLTHDEVIEVTKSSLCTLTSTDPVLSDLPLDVITEEILLLSLLPSRKPSLLSQTAAEHGKCITIFIRRENEPPLRVIVPQSATVRELKKSIERHFELSQQRSGPKVKISWKYIWKTYDLCFDGIILDDENGPIDSYGVCNKESLTFKKRNGKNR